MNAMTSERAWECVVETIREMLEQQGDEVEELKPSQALVGDLGIASMNIVHLMVTLEDKLDQPLNFYKLAARDGAVVSDLTVGEMHRFVCDSLNLGGPPAGGS
jgi:acyl carrier protein